MRCADRAHRRAATVLLVALLLPCAAVAADDPPPPVAELPARVDAWLGARMAEYGIPGVTLGLVLDGEPFLVAGYGFADVGANRPMTGSTPVRAGSVSKALTATLALVAAREGRVALDRDLRPLLADLPLRPDYGVPLTLHQLLTFTGGFDERLMGQHTRDATRHPPLDLFLRGALPPRFAAPGTVSSYNDFQTSLAGLALARTADLTFPELARRDLLAPLGLTDTTFEQVDVPERLIGRSARSYERTDGGWEPYPRDFIATTPAAGLWTTAADMTRYIQALLGGAAGAAVLPPDEWRRQYAPQWAHDPRLPAWGYGLAQARRAGREVWFKDGQASGFHARMLLVPDLGLGLFVAHNRNIIGRGGRFHDATRLVAELGDHLLETWFPAAEAPDPPPPALASGAMHADRYAGTYRTTVQSRHTVERLIALMDEIDVEVHPEGGLVAGGIHVVPVERDFFQYVDGGPHFVAFTTGADGARYVYPYGSRTAYERIPALFAGAVSVPVLLGATGLALLAALAAGTPLILRPRARHSRLRALTLVHGLLLGSGLLLVLGTFALADPQELFQGAPWWLAAAPWLVGLSVGALAAAAAAAALPALRRRRVPDRSWTHRTIVGYFLLQAAAIPWLAHWQLLPLP